MVVGLFVAACSGAGGSAPTAERVTSKMTPATTPVPSTSTSSTSLTAAPTTTPPAPVAPTSASAIEGVSAEAIFEVETTTDIVYAQALSHVDWRSEETEIIDLTLDVYEPAGARSMARPVLVMIHGGGFFNGNSAAAPMTNMATYFASRGWVAFSINYRLAGDHGTLPAFFPIVDESDPRQADQIYAIYTACRDAKASIRWMRANAETYGLDTERITVSGGSAGSITAVGLGVVDESDCRDELTIDEDPTLASTNLGQTSEIHTIVDHWGSAAMVQVVELLNGGSRFDTTDAPISIVHGTEDPTVTFDKAEQLQAAYAETGVPYAFYPLEGAGHGAWQSVVDGNSLFELAFDFIVEHQDLHVR